MTTHDTPEGPKKCNAKKGNCPLKNEDGSTVAHYDTMEEAQEAFEKKMNKSSNPLSGMKKQSKLVMSNGQMVRKGEIGTSNFVKGFSIKKGMNSYYDGSWEDLQKLVKENFDNNEPGTGSVDGDVLLVNVPSENFYTSIVKIDDSNRDQVEEVDHVRQEGEKPVGMKVIKGGEKQPAKYAQIVVYRADVLAQDDDRSTDDEWEIICVNAQDDKYTPMHPTVMLRNANHDEGGTQRTYTDKEWSDAYSYWENHAYIDSE